MQAESTGIPMLASVDTGALTSASSAATSASSAAPESLQRARNESRQNQPSNFSVQILGFGGTSIEGAAAGLQSHLDRRTAGAQAGVSTTIGERKKSLLRLD